MNSVLDEPGVERSEVESNSSTTCCQRDLEQIAKRIDKQVEDAKAAVAAKLEASRIAAERLLKRSQYKVEDGLSEMAHTIKRYPLQSVAIALAAGAVLSLFFPRSVRK
jgi:ElaB/YqjD/DUF883 family membrane-anchored ribosome-binding protein